MELSHSLLTPKMERVSHSLWTEGVYGSTLKMHLRFPRTDNMSTFLFFIMAVLIYLSKYSMIRDKILGVD